MRAPLTSKMYTLAENYEERESQTKLKLKKQPAEGVNFIEITPEKLKELRGRITNGLFPALYESSSNSIYTITV